MFVVLLLSNKVIEKNIERTTTNRATEWKKEKEAIWLMTLLLFFCTYPLGTVLHTNKNQIAFYQRENYAIYVESIAKFDFHLCITYVI